MAAECSWSASSARLARRDLTDQADEVALTIAELGDPYFASFHPRYDMRLGMTGCARRFYRCVGLLDVADIVKQHGVLAIPVLTLRRRPRQHQPHASTIKERKRRRRIEQVLHAEYVLVKLFRFFNVGNGQGDLFYAGKGDCRH